jgi:translation initiation factor IF-3
MTNYRRRNNRPQDTTKALLVNRQISAPEIRIIDEEGKMVGVFSNIEAMNLAESRELDLIEINPKGNPPVAKLMEYTKFKYQLDKSEKAKPKVSTDAKVLRVSVRVAPHDLSVQARKADEFLNKELKVKLQVQMRGREKAHPELASETMVLFLSMITAPHTLESEAKLAGDSCVCTLKPKPLQK